jgi:hypothetical protein
MYVGLFKASWIAVVLGIVLLEYLRRDFLRHFLAEAGKVYTEKHAVQDYID